MERPRFLRIDPVDGALSAWSAVGADAAAGRQRGWNRQLRTELTFISALPVGGPARAGR